MINAKTQGKYCNTRRLPTVGLKSRKRDCKDVEAPRRRKLHSGAAPGLKTSPLRHKRKLTDSTEQDNVTSGTPMPHPSASQPAGSAKFGSRREDVGGEVRKDLRSDSITLVMGGSNPRATTNGQGKLKGSLGSVEKVRAEGIDLPAGNGVDSVMPDRQSGEDTKRKEEKRKLLGKRAWKLGKKKPDVGDNSVTGTLGRKRKRRNSLDEIGPLELDTVTEEGSIIAGPLTRHMTKTGLRLDSSDMQVKRIKSSRTICEGGEVPVTGEGDSSKMPATEVIDAGLNESPCEQVTDELKDEDLPRPLDSVIDQLGVKNSPPPTGPKILLATEVAGSLNVITDLNVDKQNRHNLPKPVSPRFTRGMRDRGLCPTQDEDLASERSSAVRMATTSGVQAFPVLKGGRNSHGEVDHGVAGMTGTKGAKDVLESKDSRKSEDRIDQQGDLPSARVAAGKGVKGVLRIQEDLTSDTRVDQALESNATLKVDSMKLRSLTKLDDLTGLNGADLPWKRLEKNRARHGDESSEGHVDKRVDFELVDKSTVKDPELTASNVVASDSQGNGTGKDKVDGVVNASKSPSKRLKHKRCKSDSLAKDIVTRLEDGVEDKCTVNDGEGLIASDAVASARQETDRRNKRVDGAVTVPECSSKRGEKKRTKNAGGSVSKAEDIVRCEETMGKGTVKDAKGSAASPPAACNDQVRTAIGNEVGDGAGNTSDFPSKLLRRNRGKNAVDAPMRGAVLKPGDGAENKLILKDSEGLTSSFAVISEKQVNDTRPETVDGTVNEPKWPSKQVNGAGNTLDFPSKRLIKRRGKNADHTSMKGAVLKPGDGAENKSTLKDAEGLTSSSAVISEKQVNDTRPETVDEAVNEPKWPSKEVNGAGNMSDSPSKGLKKKQGKNTVDTPMKGAVLKPGDSAEHKLTLKGSTPSFAVGSENQVNETRPETVDGSANEQKWPSKEVNGAGNTLDSPSKRLKKRRGKNAVDAPMKGAVLKPGDGAENKLTLKDGEGLTSSFAVIPEKQVNDTHPETVDRAVNELKWPSKEVNGSENTSDFPSKGLKKKQGKKAVNTSMKDVVLKPDNAAESKLTSKDAEGLTSSFAVISEKQVNDTRPETVGGAVNEPKWPSKQMKRKRINNAVGTSAKDVDIRHSEGALEKSTVKDANDAAASDDQVRNAGNELGDRAATPSERHSKRLRRKHDSSAEGTVLRPADSLEDRSTLKGPDVLTVSDAMVAERGTNNTGTKMTADEAVNRSKLPSKRVKTNRDKIADDTLAKGKNITHVDGAGGFAVSDAAVSDNQVRSTGNEVGYGAVNADNQLKSTGNEVEDGLLNGLEQLKKRLKKQDDNSVNNFAEGVPSHCGEDSARTNVQRGKILTRSSKNDSQSKPDPELEHKLQDPTSRHLSGSTEDRRVLDNDLKKDMLPGNESIIKKRNPKKGRIVGRYKKVGKKLDSRGLLKAFSSQKKICMEDALVFERTVEQGSNLQSQGNHQSLQIEASVQLESERVESALVDQETDECCPETENLTAGGGTTQEVMMDQDDGLKLKEFVKSSNLTVIVEDCRQIGDDEQGPEMLQAESHDSDGKNYKTMPSNKSPLKPVEVLHTRRDGSGPVKETASLRSSTRRACTELQMLLKDAESSWTVTGRTRRGKREACIQSGLETGGDHSAGVPELENSALNASVIRDSPGEPNRIVENDNPANVECSSESVDVEVPGISIQNGSNLSVEDDENLKKLSKRTPFVKGGNGLNGKSASGDSGGRKSHSTEGGGTELSLDKGVHHASDVEHGGVSSAGILGEDSTELIQKTLQDTMKGSSQPNVVQKLGRSALLRKKLLRKNLGSQVNYTVKTRARHCLQPSASNAETEAHMDVNEDPGMTQQVETGFSEVQIVKEGMHNIQGLSASGAEMTKHGKLKISALLQEEKNHVGQQSDLMCLLDPTTELQPESLKVKLRESNREAVKKSTSSTEKQFQRRPKKVRAGEILKSPFPNRPSDVTDVMDVSKPSRVDKNSLIVEVSGGNVVEQVAGGLVNVGNMKQAPDLRTYENDSNPEVSGSTALSSLTLYPRGPLGVEDSRQDPQIRPCATSEALRTVEDGVNGDAPDPSAMCSRRLSSTEKQFQRRPKKIRAGEILKIPLPDRPSDVSQVCNPSRVNENSLTAEVSGESVVEQVAGGLENMQQAPDLGSDENGSNPDVSGSTVVPTPTACPQGPLGVEFNMQDPLVNPCPTSDGVHGDALDMSAMCSRRLSGTVKKFQRRPKKVRAEISGKSVVEQVPGGLVDVENMKQAPDLGIDENGSNPDVSGSTVLPSPTLYPQGPLGVEDSRQDPQIRPCQALRTVEDGVNGDALDTSAMCPRRLSSTEKQFQRRPKRIRAGEILKSPLSNRPSDVMDVRQASKPSRVDENNLTAEVPESVVEQVAGGLVNVENMKQVPVLGSDENGSNLDVSGFTALPSPTFHPLGPLGVEESMQDPHVRQCATSEALTTVEYGDALDTSAMYSRRQSSTVKKFQRRPKKVRAAEILKSPLLNQPSNGTDVKQVCKPSRVDENSLTPEVTGESALEQVAGGLVNGENMKQVPNLGSDENGSNPDVSGSTALPSPSLCPQEDGRQDPHIRPCATSQALRTVEDGANGGSLDMSAMCSRRLSPGSPVDLQDVRQVPLLLPDPHGVALRTDEAGFNPDTVDSLSMDPKILSPKEPDNVEDSRGISKTLPHLTAGALKTCEDSAHLIPSGISYRGLEDVEYIQELHQVDAHPATKSLRTDEKGLNLEVLNLGGISSVGVPLEGQVNLELVGYAVSKLPAEVVTTDTDDMSPECLDSSIAFMEVPPVSRVDVKDIREGHEIVTVVTQPPDGAFEAAGDGLHPKATASLMLCPGKSEPEGPFGLKDRKRIPADVLSVLPESLSASEDGFNCQQSVLLCAALNSGNQPSEGQISQNADEDCASLDQSYCTHTVSIGPVGSASEVCSVSEVCLKVPTGTAQPFFSDEDGFNPELSKSCLLNVDDLCANRMDSSGMGNVSSPIVAEVSNENALSQNQSTIMASKISSVSLGLVNLRESKATVDETRRGHEVMNFQEENHVNAIPLAQLEDTPVLGFGAHLVAGLRKPPDKELLEPVIIKKTALASGSSKCSLSDRLPFQVLLSEVIWGKSSIFEGKSQSSLHGGKLPKSQSSLHGGKLPNQDSVKVRAIERSSDVLEPVNRSQLLQLVNTRSDKTKETTSGSVVKDRGNAAGDLQMKDARCSAANAETTVGSGETMKVAVNIPATTPSPQAGNTMSEILMEVSPSGLFSVEKNHVAPGELCGGISHVQEMGNADDELNEIMNDESTVENACLNVLKPEQACAGLGEVPEMKGEEQPKQAFVDQIQVSEAEKQDQEEHDQIEAVEVKDQTWRFCDVQIKEHGIKGEKHCDLQREVRGRKDEDQVLSTGEGEMELYERKDENRAIRACEGWKELNGEKNEVLAMSSFEGQNKLHAGKDEHQALQACEDQMELPRGRDEDPAMQSCGVQMTEHNGTDTDHAVQVSGGEMGLQEGTHEDPAMGACEVQMEEHEGTDRDHAVKASGGEMELQEGKDEDPAMQACEVQMEGHDEADTDHAVQASGGEMELEEGTDEDLALQASGGQMESHGGMDVNHTIQACEGIMELNEGKNDDQAIQAYGAERELHEKSERLNSVGVQRNMVDGVKLVNASKKRKGRLGAELTKEGELQLQRKAWEGRDGTDREEDAASRVYSQKKRFLLSSTPIEPGGMRIRPRPLDPDQALPVFWEGRDKEFHEYDGGSFYKWLQQQEEARVTRMASELGNVGHGESIRLSTISKSNLVHKHPIFVPLFRKLPEYEQMDDSIGEVQEKHPEPGKEFSVPGPHGYQRYTRPHIRMFGHALGGSFSTVPSVYDMDGEDEEWLKGYPRIQNEASAEELLSEDLFEELMELFERECVRIYNWSDKSFRVPSVEECGKGASSGQRLKNLEVEIGQRIRLRLKVTGDHGRFSSSQDTCEGSLFQKVSERQSGNLVQNASDECCICNGGENSELNLVYRCKLCSINVHQSCYGICEGVGSESDCHVPTLNWCCRKCEAVVAGRALPSVSCAICCKSGGAMKVTVDPLKWAHIACALYTNETFFVDPEAMEPIDGLVAVEARVKKQRERCGLCGVREGSCVRCASRGCRAPFHISCGVNQGASFELRHAKQLVVGVRSFCPHHATVVPVRALDENECVQSSKVPDPVELLPTVSTESSDTLEMGQIRQRNVQRDGKLSGLIVDEINNSAGWQVDEPILDKSAAVTKKGNSGVRRKRSGVRERGNSNGVVTPQGLFPNVGHLDVSVTDRHEADFCLPQASEEKLDALSTVTSGSSIHLPLSLVNMDHPKNLISADEAQLGSSKLRGREGPVERKVMTKEAGSSALPDSTESGVVCRAVDSGLTFPELESLETSLAPAHIVKAVYSYWQAKRARADGPILHEFKQLESARKRGIFNKVMGQSKELLPSSIGHESPPRIPMIRRPRSSGRDLMLSKMLELKQQMEMLRNIARNVVRREQLKRDDQELFYESVQHQLLLAREKSKSSHCHWCWNTQHLLSCTSCPKVFCFHCFKRRRGYGVKGWAAAWKLPQYVCNFCLGNSPQKTRPDCDANLMGSTSSELGGTSLFGDAPVLGTLGTSAEGSVDNPGRTNSVEQAGLEQEIMKELDTLNSLHGSSSSQEEARMGAEEMIDTLPATEFAVPRPPGINGTVNRMNNGEVNPTPEGAHNKQQLENLESECEAGKKSRKKGLKSWNKKQGGTQGEFIPRTTNRIKKLVRSPSFIYGSEDDNTVSESDESRVEKKTVRLSELKDTLGGSPCTNSMPLSPERATETGLQPLKFSLKWCSSVGKLILRRHGATEQSVISTPED